jgi:hypothetical protein
MRQNLKINPNKECSGCKIPDLWSIGELLVACWMIKKYFKDCPCKTCVVKPMCKNRCKEKDKMGKMHKDLTLNDVTYISIKRRKRGK